MSVHPSGHGTAQGPERDALAEDIHTTVTGLALPHSGVDLSWVRRRGQRRRTARRALIAAPVLAAVLAGGAAITHLSPSASITPAEHHTSSTLQATDPNTVATAAFQDALRAMDPDVDWDTEAAVMVNGDTDQQIGWATTYQDKRSDPPARLVLSVSALGQGKDAYNVATGCFATSQCTTDELGSGVRLVTSTGTMTDTAVDGASFEGTHSQVSAVYPNGRIVNAYAQREPATQAGLGAEASFDSPLITKDDLRVLVTNAGLAELPLPTPSPTASR